MRYKVAIDIDDVLAQFYPAMCRRMGQPCKRINIWDGKGEAHFVAANFHIVENNRRFWLGLEKESRPEDITFEFSHYITASPPLMRQYREEWLKMMGFPHKPVIAAEDKAQVMRRLHIDVLVDDKPATLEHIQSQGLIGIQYVPSYMSDEREHLNPIRHLSQVPEVLLNL